MRSSPNVWLARWICFVMVSAYHNVSMWCSQIYFFPIMFISFAICLGTLSLTPYREGIQLHFLIPVLKFCVWCLWNLFLGVVIGGDLIRNVPHGGTNCDTICWIITIPRAEAHNRCDLDQVLTNAWRPLSSPVCSTDGSVCPACLSPYFNVRRLYSESLHLLGKVPSLVLLSWLFFALNCIRLMWDSVCQLFEKLHWDLDRNHNEFIDESWGELTSV